MLYHAILPMLVYYHAISSIYYLANLPMYYDDISTMYYSASLSIGNTSYIKHEIWSILKAYQVKEKSR